MFGFLVFLHAILVALLTLRILYRDNISSSARLAWFIGFAALPVVGSVVYLLFGEIYISSKLVQRHSRALGQLQALESAETRTPDHQVLSQIDPGYRTVFRYGMSINGFPPTAGNAITLLDSSEQFVDQLIADIDAAQTRVSILYYIWLTDNTGTRVARALIRAAGRGVTCRVMVDEVGSRKFLRSSLWTQMKDAGVHCGVAMPLERLYAVRVLNRFDLRNHRKITVIDGQIGYCGSRNCADPEFRTKAKFAPWVDIMTRLTGPAVNQMEALFFTDWAASGQQPPISEFSFAPSSAPEGQAIAQVRGTGPLKRAGSASQSMSAAIHSAQRELMITTPYFVPDMSTFNAICKAAYSGVKVTLTVPARNDSLVVGAASRSHYKVLLEAGVDIREYQPGLLHSKIMTVDGVFCIIGSSNLDMRSFDLNYENDLLIYDKATTGQIRARQLAYLEDTRRIDREAVMQWSSVRRIWYNVMGTLGPVL